MTTNSQPFWTVQSVFDPDMTGQNFAYTMGLAAKGKPELHMWANPTDGDDPGADYKLSSNDMGGLLNRLAWDWLAGDLQVGDKQSFPLDYGLSEMIVVIGEPCDADSLEAFGARPSLVVPVLWELRRPDRGGPVDLNRQDRQDFEDDVRWLRARCDPAAHLKYAGTSRDEVDFATDQRFGPLSDWVEVNARFVATTVMPAPLMEIIASEASEDRRSLISLMTISSRVSGRDAQVAEVKVLADEVAHRVTRQRAWRDLIDSVERPRGVSQSRARHNASEVVNDFITSVLIGCALEDVLPAEFRLAATSAWRAALHFELAA